MENLLALIGLIIIIAFFGLGPLLTIWSMNTLFSLSIAYNFWTWLAAVFLIMFSLFLTRGGK